MSRFRTLLVALLATGLVIGTAGPAAAHDELLSSTPSAGDRLATAPERVSLTFSGEVLTTGAAVIVVDAEGHDWVVAEPEIVGSTVTAVLDDGMPDAGFEIRWRVVSSDGHPISGFVPFTVGEGAPLARPAESGAADTDETGATDVAAQSAHEAEGALRVVILGLGGAAIAAVLFFLLSFILRRRARADGAGRPDKDGDPDSLERHAP